MPATVDVTTPSDREIRVTRAFAAPPSLVFDFHTKSEHVAKWLLGPPGWSMPVCEIDLRPGGRYEYRWRNDANGREFGVRGEFVEVVSPERIVHVERMDGASGEAHCTLAFAANGAGTVLTTTMRFDSKQARDEALESGMTDGMAASYDRLESIAAAAAH